MRRLALIAVALVALGAFVVSAATAKSERTYEIVFDNAFGLVKGSDVKVAGVKAGSITGLDINDSKKAVATVKLTLDGFDHLRTDATCKSLPQSLIAEFFIDCDPGKNGAELKDGGTVPVENTKITVQPDLVNNVLREPYEQRLQLIINEFGTGLAGRPHDLNDALRRGTPALADTRKVLDLLATQNQTIRDLNVDSDVIIRALAQNRQNVTRFVSTARASAEASAERRADLGRDFQLLPKFLAELKPTMHRLGQVAGEQTPLLRDLRAAAPGLATLASRIPPFASSSKVALASLGKAAVIGRRALSKGRDEIAELRRASRPVERVSSETNKLLTDLDDPTRAPEANKVAAQLSGRPPPTGYSGFEAILQYAYTQALAVNQFDEIGYTLRIQLNEAAGPCGKYSADYAKEADGKPQRCVSWLGPNQPGLTQKVDIPKYDPSVCPQGSADLTICDPKGPSTAAASAGTRTLASPTAAAAPQALAATTDDSTSRSQTPPPRDTQLPEPLQGLLDLPGKLLGGQNGRNRNGLGDLLNGRSSDSGSRTPRDRATTNDLLDFLFAD